MNENTTDNNNEEANELAPQDLSRVNEITQVAKEIYEDFVTDMGSMEKRDIKEILRKSKKSYESPPRRGELKSSSSPG